MMIRKLCLRYCLLAIAATTMLVAGRTPPAFAGKPAPAPSFPPMPINYLVTWLDPLPGGISTEARSSNSAGTVVGYSTGSTGANDETRACVWTTEGVFDLNALAPVPSDWVLITAKTINEFGQIAGSAGHQLTGQIRPYRYDPPTETSSSQIVLMGDPTSSASYHITYIRPLNNLGDVSYAVTLTDGKTYSYVHYVQAMDGTLFQRQGGSLNSINDSRQVVGQNIRWNATSGLVETFSSSIHASDINATGTFAGQLDTSGRTKKAMRYTTSAQVIGPSSSIAFGINSSNDVVGYVNDTGVGFIFTDAYGYVDLDTRVIAANANDLTAWNSASSIQPIQITDHVTGGFGAIVGTADFAGSHRAFLLTPIPTAQ